MYLVTYGSHTEHINNHMVGNRTKLFPQWTKSWLGWRLACWTPAKAKSKNRSMSGAGDGQLGGRLQQVSGRPRHSWLRVRVAQLRNPCVVPMRVFRTTSRRETPTCVVDTCFSVPNLGGSVVSDGGDTRPATGTPGYVLGVGDTNQTSFCQPEGIMSGAQPVCEPLPPSAPNIDSKSVLDVCSDLAEEGSLPGFRCAWLRY